MFFRENFHSIGSPFVCNVYSNDFNLENYEYASINKQTSLLIKPKLNSLFNPNIQVYITTPSGTRMQGKIEKTSTDSYSIDFLPNEIGDHEIQFCNDELNTTAFICQVYDTSKISISDLTPAVTHQPYIFTSNNCGFFSFRKFIFFL